MTGYLKMVVMLQSGVCYHCAALDGQRWYEKLGELSYFRNDLLIAVIAVPALLSVLGRLAPRRILAGAVAAVSAGLYLYLFAQAQCVLTVGGLVTPDLLLQGLVWAANAPEAGSAYLPGSEIFFVVGGLAIIGAALRREIRAGRGRLDSRTSGSAAARSVAVAAGLVTSAAWLWPMPATVLHDSILLRALRPSSSWTPPADTVLAGMPAEPIVREYRRLCRAPQPKKDPRYWAAMAGADVLFFVFETGPARCLPIDGPLDDFPALARLRRKAFIAPRHFTTAPVTTLAVLSIFNSLYPAGSGIAVTKAARTAPLPGLPLSAARSGYSTEYYVDFPLEAFPDYAEQLRLQGFGKVRGVETSPRRLEQGADLSERERALRPGRAAGTSLRRSLRQKIAAGRRYLAVFFPMVGHAPWLDIFDGRYPALYERGRAYMALQDRWLGAIMDELERAGRLDRTIIVVTADHGIRTRKEDPDFPVGATDAVSFQVPLLIWAPGAVDATVTIPYPTSHIDIAPTVLDLLGLAEGREFEQGAPVWDARIGGRETYYLGKFITGSDCIYRRGTFYMYHYLTGSLRQSGEMQFRLAGRALPDSQRRREILDRLARFGELQRSLLKALTGDPR